MVELLRVFRNVRQMPDYGKHVRWPSPPLTLRNTVTDFQSIHNRWRAQMILNNVPRNEWPQLRIKVTAGDALMGKRVDWGFRDKWEGNYLASNQENDDSSAFQSAVRNMKNKDSFREVLFSCLVRKINKSDKMAERAILVTDKQMYKLHSKTFKALRSPIPIQELTGLSVSPGQDQLIVLHLRGGNDFVISLISRENYNRIGELVGLLLRQYQLLCKSELKVQVQTSIQCMLGNKTRIITVEETEAGSFAAFRRGKKRGELIYMWPSSLNKTLPPPPQTKLHHRHAPPAPPSHANGNGHHGYGNGKNIAYGNNNKQTNGSHLYANNGQY